LLIRAEQKYVRISPQKLRLVAEAISHLSPGEAVSHLRFLNKKAALSLAKVIKQAISNAVNNSKLKEEELRFAKIEIGPGAILKRWRPVSRGRAHSILKRTSHIKIILKSKEQSEKSQNNNQSRTKIKEGLSKQ
jgi:large subunit ribosomal protein L22